MLPLAEARKLALDTTERMSRGLAPAPAAAPTAPKTFAKLREAYLKSRMFQERLKPRTRIDYDRKLHHPTWRPFEQMAPEEITRGLLLDLCDRLAHEDRAYSNLLRPVAAMYTWAVDRGIVATSPCVRLRLPRNSAAPNPLSPEDMRQALLAVDTYAAERKSEGLDPSSWVAVYKLCAYSGQRPTTWADARGEHLDAGLTTLSVPALRYENGRPFAVALPPRSRGDPQGATAHRRPALPRRAERGGRVRVANHCA